MEARLSAYSSKSKDEKQQQRHPSLLKSTCLQRNEMILPTILPALTEISAWKAQLLYSRVPTFVCLLNSLSFKSHSEFSGWGTSPDFSESTRPASLTQRLRC